jgi:hypothetical protein
MRAKEERLREATVKLRDHVKLTGTIRPDDLMEHSIAVWRATQLGGGLTFEEIAMIYGEILSGKTP